MLSVRVFENYIIFRSEDRYQGSKGLGFNYLKSKLSGCEPGEYTSLPSKHNHYPVHPPSHHNQSRHKSCQHDRINGVSTCSADCTKDMSWKPVSLARTQSFGHKSSGRYDTPKDECQFAEDVKHHEHVKCSSLSCKLGAVSIDDCHNYDVGKVNCGSLHGAVSCKNDKFCGALCGHITRGAEEDAFHEHSRHSSSVHSAHRYPESASSMKFNDAHPLPSPVKEDKAEEDTSSSPMFDRRRSLDVGVFAKIESLLSIEDICHQLVGIGYLYY